MPQEIVLRKRERDGNKVCTTYGISETSYKFTLDTCDNIEATIKNTSGLTVAILTLNAPTTVVSKKGNYNICIEGVGIGTLYAEWTQSGSGGGEDCCDELREKDQDLQNQINNLKSRVVNIETIINNLGDNCCDELRTEINNLKTRITNVENHLNNQNITGGTGISVTKNGDSYVITNTGGSGGGGSDCCDELRNEINNIKTRLTTIEGDISNLKSRMTTVEGNVTNITNRFNNQNIIGGTGISVTKSGDNYTITNTAPGGGGGSGATDCCDELRQKDTELQQQITNVTNRLNNQNITGGTGISVTKSGDSYTITNTAPVGGGQDKDTVTTLVPGDGVSITDSGTGGNHVYTITASGGSGGDDVDIVSTSANLTVTMEIV